MDHFQKKRKNIKVPDDIRAQIKEYYLATGCSSKELAAHFNVGLHTCANIADEALTEFQNKLKNKKI